MRYLFIRFGLDLIWIWKMGGLVLKSRETFYFGVCGRLIWDWHFAVSVASALYLICWLYIRT